MEDLIRQGKVLYWGVSVWTASQITAACAAADRWGGYRPVTNQPPYSLLERGIEAEVVPECARLGLGPIVWSPLAHLRRVHALALLQVGAGAEHRAVRAYEDELHGFLHALRRGEQRVAQLDIERVSALGTIQRDRRHAVAHVDEDGHIALAPRSSAMRSSL
jgi:aryl-alcohol dehydrogenase-like predicted oxidoreductase